MADAAPRMSLDDRVRLSVELAKARTGRKIIARRVSADPKLVSLWLSVARALGHDIPRLAARPIVGKDEEIKRLYNQGLLIKQIAHRVGLTETVTSAHINAMQQRNELAYRLPRVGKRVKA